MKNRGKKPSQTRRRRESVAAKRRARAFYKMRTAAASCGGDVLDREEAEGLAPWRGFGTALAALAALAATAVVAWIAAEVL